MGLALDAEGIAPAKLYYERFGVTFPALVDPNYATGFGAVPKTFLIDEHGVVQELDDWKARIEANRPVKPVTPDIRDYWMAPGQRLSSESIARLVESFESNPRDLQAAVDLSSRYLDLNLPADAKRVLTKVTKPLDPLQVARGNNSRQSQLLGQAYFQLARASQGDREDQVRYATLSFYLNPSVGFGKQIARMIAPEKFDHRPDGDFDNEFREGTLRRLRAERSAWLDKAPRPNP